MQCYMLVTSQSWGYKKDTEASLKGLLLAKHGTIWPSKRTINSVGGSTLDVLKSMNL